MTKERFLHHGSPSSYTYIMTPSIGHEPSKDSDVDTQILDSIVKWVIRKVLLTLEDIRVIGVTNTRPRQQDVARGSHSLDILYKTTSK